MLDMVIRGATIFDGAQTPAFRGSVGIQGDRIVFVGKDPDGPQASSRDVIDGEGLVCCPGFIDTHSHADCSLAYYPDASSSLVQGITTFVGGNCGISMAPAANAAFREKIYAYEHTVDVPGWDTFGAWLGYVRSLPIGPNYAPLVGHNMIRGSVLGLDYEREARPEEIGRELALLDEALDAGAFGMSISFDAGVPGHYAGRAEVDALFKRLEERDSYVTAHTRHHQNQWPIRNPHTHYGVFYGPNGDILCGRYHGFVEFLEYIARAPKLRASVSHLTNAFLAPMPHSQTFEDAMVDETLRLFIDEPVQQGLAVYFTAIPSPESISSAVKVIDNIMVGIRPYAEFREYASGSSLVEALGDTAFRGLLREHITSGLFKFGMICPATDPYWADTFVIVKARDGAYAGKTPMQIARARHPGAGRLGLVYRECIETLFDLVVEDPDITWALVRDKREYMAFQRLLSHPHAMPMSDSVVIPLDEPYERNILGMGAPPTACSIFVRYLCDMVKEGPLSPQEGIHRLTGLPARVMGLTDRGTLREGAFADIVLLDWEALSYRTDFLNPTLLPSGVEYVFVNGVCAVRGGKLTKQPAGRVLAAR
jgi:N-acyl-D-aspartate/D-glutamate deacylase